MTSANEIIISIIRTVVPTMVGSLTAWLTVRGITLDATDVTGMSAFLTAVFSGLYYIAVRSLEIRFPQLGWLLGVAQQPSYKETK